MFLFGRIDRHSDDGADFIRDEIRVMLHYACCGLIILICPLEFPTSERQLARKHDPDHRLQPGYFPAKWKPQPRTNAVLPLLNVSPVVVNVIFALLTN